MGIWVGKKEGEADIVNRAKRSSVHHLREKVQRFFRVLRGFSGSFRVFSNHYTFKLEHAMELTL